MRSTLTVAVGSTLLLLFIAGCNRGSLAISYHDHRSPPERTYVHVDHVCTDHCDEYYDGHRVVVIRGHHHGPGCGHVWDGRHWVVIRKAPARETVRPIHGPRKAVVVEHVHGPDCGCVYDRAGSKWVRVKRGHVHGPHCGHLYVEGRWVIRR
ncbi:MAG: hypothetical protein J5J06_14925 [Phycisphaerae bacterium]|nr:hypothetical protein [Phycisphaerae bacterium]